MSERIKVGLSLVDLWGKYGARKVKYEVKRRQVTKLASNNLEKIRELGGSLKEGQVTFIDRTDALARSLSQADFSSAQGMKQFVEDFPDQLPDTQSLSVLQRRDQLIQQRTKEAGELMDDYGHQLVDVTKRFIRSLF